MRHGLSVGMKVEALHPITQRDICPATVVAVPDQVHFVIEFDELWLEDIRLPKEPAPPVSTVSTRARHYIITLSKM